MPLQNLMMKGMLLSSASVLVLTLLTKDVKAVPLGTRAETATKVYPNDPGLVGYEVTTLPKLELTSTTTTTQLQGTATCGDKNGDGGNVAINSNMCGDDYVPKPGSSTESCTNTPCDVGNATSGDQATCCEGRCGRLNFGKVYKSGMHKEAPFSSEKTTECFENTANTDHWSLISRLPAYSDLGKRFRCSNSPIHYLTDKRECLMIAESERWGFFSVSKDAMTNHDHAEEVYMCALSMTCGNPVADPTLASEHKVESWKVNDTAMDSWNQELNSAACGRCKTALTALQADLDNDCTSFPQICTASGERPNPVNNEYVAYWKSAAGRLIGKCYEAATVGNAPKTSCDKINNLITKAGVTRVQKFWDDSIDLTCSLIMHYNCGGLSQSASSSANLLQLSTAIKVTSKNTCEM